MTKQNPSALEALKFHARRAGLTEEQADALGDDVRRELVESKESERMSKRSDYPAYPITDISPRHGMTMRQRYKLTVPCDAAKFDTVKALADFIGWGPTTDEELVIAAAQAAAKAAGIYADEMLAEDEAHAEQGAGQ